MKNKLVELLVCMLVVGTCFVVVPYTVRGLQDGDYTYTESDGVATITGYNGTGGVVIIPLTLGGYPTMYIGDNAFSSNNGTLITSIDIPNSVKTIGNYAFRYCSNLTNVTIGRNVTTIGNAAFSRCSNLTKVTIGNNVTTIGEYAFNYSSKLTSINIPDSVKTIGDYAFYYCSNLTNVIIGNSVTTIGEYTFRYCSKLASINIPDSVETIGNYAFNYCSNLTSVNIGNNVTTIGNAAFSRCSNLTSVNIGNNVTTIGEYAFNYCSKLTSINIPDSVETIGNYAFNYCSNLTSVNIGNNVTTIGEYAFNYSSKLTSINIPDSVETIGQYAFYHCSNLTNLTIGNNVTTIGYATFARCFNLTNVTIGNNVTAIGEYAFNYCSNLTSITFLGLVKPTTVDNTSWIQNTNIGIRGHAYYNSNFPLPGNRFNGLMMGSTIYNNPPIITTVDVPLAVENVNYLVDYDLTDVDGGIPTWSLETNASSFLSIDAGTGVLSGTPTNTNVGVWYYVNVSVNDGYGGSDFSNFTLTVTNVTLTITKSGTGSGTVEISPSSYYFGTNITIWANASTGSTFAGFSGDLTGTVTPRFLVMDENKTVNTQFTKKSGGGGGGDNGGTQPSENQKPVADLSAGEPYQCFVNSEITFDGSKSSDSDGNITNWAWFFGDTMTGNGKTVRHTYARAGTYTVTLTVTDEKGATNTDTTTCIVTQPNRPPATPTITGLTSGMKNTLYTYTTASTDADNDTIQYTFNWGDQVSQSSGFLPNGTSFSLNHSWAAPGRYDVTVTASDNKTTSSSKITVYIDAEQTGDIGYLLDNDGNGIYDAFYSDQLQQTLAIQEKDGSYNIDNNGDGKWDYTFDTAKGLATYQQPKTPGFEIILVVCAIALVFLWKRKRKDNK